MAQMMVFLELIQIKLVNKVSESSVSAIDVNGYPAGEYTTFKIEDNGLITANYSNQQKRVVGQVALSAFANPNGLVSQGGNVWASSNTSGNPMDGVPVLASSEN